MEHAVVARRSWVNAQLVQCLASVHMWVLSAWWCPGEHVNIDAALWIREHAGVQQPTSNGWWQVDGRELTVGTLG